MASKTPGRKTGTRTRATTKAKAEPAEVGVPQEGAPDPETVADSLNAAIHNIGTDPPSVPEPPA